jgi:aspartate/methionine/tyrosine aminotransferase
LSKLYHICTVLAPGLSRLITTDPGWPWPGRFVHLQGVPVTTVEVYSAEAGYKLTAAALAEVIEPRSLLYLIDPLNPLGSSYRRDELEAIVELARPATRSWCTTARTGTSPTGTPWWPSCTPRAR